MIQTELYFRQWKGNYIQSGQEKYCRPRLILKSWKVIFLILQQIKFWRLLKSILVGIDCGGYSPAIKGLQDSHKYFVNLKTIYIHPITPRTTFWHYQISFDHYSGLNGLPWIISHRRLTTSKDKTLYSTTKPILRGYQRQFEISEKWNFNPFCWTFKLIWGRHSNKWWTYQ
jgi:hypothetical protein